MRNALLVVSLLLSSMIATAEVTLDEKFPWDEGKDPTKKILEGGWRVGKQLDHELVQEGFHNDISHSAGIFRMTWDGEVFYVAGIDYQSIEQWNSYGKLPGDKYTPLPGGGICSVFIYDANLQRVAQHDVNLPEANGHTWCNGANALARVKGQDALLFSVSYYLTDAPIAKSMEDIGSDWRYITVLLRLKKENGHVTITQDDSCLGNPNTYRATSDAKKALTKCQ